MSMASIASMLALALAVVALGVSMVTLWFQRSPPDVSALKSRVENLDLDLTEIADRVTHWMRRDSTRNARAGRGEFIPPQAVPQTLEQKKAELRKKVGVV